MKYVVVMLAVLASFTFAACGGGQPAAEQPAAPPVAPAPSGDAQAVEVAMSEFKFDLTPAEVRAGRVRFALKNTGAVEHSFVIEDVGKGTEQVRPGQETALEVELAPGTYTVICDVAGHREAGMTLELVVK